MNLNPSFLSLPHVWGVGIGYVWQVTLRRRKCLPLLFNRFKFGFNTEVAKESRDCIMTVVERTSSCPGFRLQLAHGFPGILSVKPSRCLSCIFWGWWARAGQWWFPSRVLWRDSRFFCEVVEPAFSQLPGFLPIQFFPVAFNGPQSMIISQISVILK